MTTELEVGLYILILAGFLGYHLITRVPPLLHTPLMSATNAIAGISLVGSLVIAGQAETTAATVLGTIAVACSATNVVGGFLITDRMLRMFKKDAGKTTGRRIEPGLAVLLTTVVSIVGVLALLSWASTRAEGIESIVPRDTAAHALRYSYILSAALFILGLKGLSSPKSARSGMFLAEIGMLLAIIGTLFHPEIVTFKWIILGLVVGVVAGAPMGLRIPMTAVPQRTALSHSLGALAACLVGVAHFSVLHGDVGAGTMVPLGFQVVIGGLTFTGSLMAAAKLQGLLPGHPLTYKGQNILNLALMALIATLLAYLVASPDADALFYIMVGLALVFGVLLVIPIGAADMPVIIALLNSYGGLADAAMGFVLANKIQIVTGALDGTSGFLLAMLMCRAMNRSAFNVLFGAFGKPQAKAVQAGDEMEKGTVRTIVPEEMATLLEGARSVIIVPGYGMAVAQAQFAVAEFASLLVKRGIDVKYAIHPVAGRMPGHMNVLLAEANIPYDQLYEMEQINAYFGAADMALVVGANDVTNPAAKTNKDSPLYGMPILEVDRAKSIVVLKRSMRPGFAGVDNDLYYNPNCMMLFGDAKSSLTALCSAMK